MPQNLRQRARAAARRQIFTLHKLHVAPRAASSVLENFIHIILGPLWAIGALPAAIMLLSSKQGRYIRKQEQLGKDQLWEDQLKKDQLKSKQKKNKQLKKGSNSAATTSLNSEQR